MPSRNGPRSRRGRSAVARTVMFGGATPTNAIMPTVFVIPYGYKKPIKTNYFGGPIKGGSQPSVGMSNAAPWRQAAGPGLRNYLFIFKTSYGPKPFGPYIV